MQAGFYKLEECCWMSALWACQQDIAFVPPWHQEWSTSLTCSFCELQSESSATVQEKEKNNHPFHA